MPTHEIVKAKLFCPVWQVIYGSQVTYSSSAARIKEAEQALDLLTLEAKQILSLVIKKLSFDFLADVMRL